MYIGESSGIFFISSLCVMVVISLVSILFLFYAVRCDAYVIGYIPLVFPGLTLKRFM